jgi:hypothetical protein
VPDQWRRLNGSIGQQIETWGTLFLHERRASGGEPRLVGVDVAGWSRGGPVILFARIRTFTPPAPLRLPTQETLDHASVRLATSEGPVRLFPGKPDPADRSHFTIDYTVGGQPGTLDGYLKSDGRVILEPRMP